MAQSNVPKTLTKLGMSIFNPLKDDKIDYLSKFIVMTNDFKEQQDVAEKKRLLYQAFAYDPKFRIQELTDDDKSDLGKLCQAIIKQEHGDSVDLMKCFDSAQLKQGEHHLNFFHRNQ